MAETTKKRGRKKVDIETKPIVEITENTAKETVQDAAPETVTAIAPEIAPEIKETVEQVEVKGVVTNTAVAEVVEETVVEKKPAQKKKAEKKTTAKADDKRQKIKAGDTYTLPFARLYSSSVAKLPICVCSGDTVIISTDIHDGRINVNNLGTGYTGWIDVTEIK